MCKIAETLDRRGFERGIEKGIMILIKDNLIQGVETEKILEKVMSYFSVSLKDAEKFYNQAVAGWGVVHQYNSSIT